MNADTITIESDERGFELHLIDEDGEHHSWNIHAIAEELYDTVKREIGPWVAEGQAARHEYDRRVSADFPEMQPVLDAIRGVDEQDDLWQKTRDQAYACADPEGDWIEDQRHHADLLIKARKENP